MASVSLAEPRRRQKWTLNPRGAVNKAVPCSSPSMSFKLVSIKSCILGNLWANDDNKFGHKLMEKMGWEKGKGLGANQVNSL